MSLEKHLILPNNTQLKIINANALMSELIMFASDRLKEFDAAKQIITETDDDGNEIPIGIRDNPDLKYWFTELRRAATESAKLNHEFIVQDGLAKIHVFDSLAKSGALTQDMKKEIALKYMKKTREANFA